MSDRKRSVEVYRSWADRSWREQCSADPEQYAPGAYVAGYKDGFVDFVFAGGSGEPPPVPPRPFWNVEERNPRGRSEATEWFAGYRHGAQVAREEGYRQRALVPSSMFLFGPQEDYRADRPHELEPFSAPLENQRQPELLPTSRPLPKAIPDRVEPELPSVESVPPAIAAPTMDLPSADMPEAEKLPLPLNVPEETELPLQPVPSEILPEEQPAPEEAPPEERRSPPNVDEIFDSTARHPSSNSLEVVRQSNYEHADTSDAEDAEDAEDAFVRQTRAAFSSAIRRHLKTNHLKINHLKTPPAAAKKSGGGRIWSSSSDAQPMRRQSQKTRVRDVAPRRIPSRTATTSAPRPATIPRSKDRAAEMFRRLSQ